ncbi:MAG: Hsp20/alpha crystallin family protein [Candidatus Sumerlaeaceae bacterium]|jgi:HSP20 family protein
MKSVNLIIRQMANASDAFEEDLLRWASALFAHSRPQFMPAKRTWTPPADVFETEDAIHIKMEIAGVQEKDLDVRLSGRYLVVQGKRDDDSRVRKDQYHLMEIQYGAFERVFALPEHFEPQDVKATLQNGFLTIELKKIPYHPQEVRIAIQ